MISPTLDRVAGLLATSGFEAWEAFLLSKRSTLVEVRGSRDVLAHQVLDAGIGLRGYACGRLGFASTTGLEDEGLRECVRRLLEASRVSEPGEAFSLPAPNLPEQLFEAFSPSAEQNSLEAGAALARRAEASASGCDGVFVSESQYRTDVGTIAVLNSRGLEASFRFSRASLHLACEASDGGKTASFTSACHAYQAGSLLPEAFGLEVSRLTRARAAARRTAPGKDNLVLSPKAAAFLASLCAPLASGERAPRAETDEALGSQAFTLVDDARLPGGYGSTPFDGEGVATGRHTFIERGVRKSFAHTATTAAASGCPSTGHALRSDFAFPPRLGFHNLHLAPTPGVPADLLREIQEGLYLVELGGNSRGGPTGPFALRGWGFRIDRGELAEPVESEIGEVAPGELLLRLRAVGPDLVTFAGGVGGSTCFFEGIPSS